MCGIAVLVIIRFPDRLFIRFDDFYTTSREPLARLSVGIHDSTAHLGYAGFRIGWNNAFHDACLLGLHQFYPAIKRPAFLAYVSRNRCKVSNPI